MAVVAEFESQDWVRDLLQATSNPAKEKTFIDPNVAFPFQKTSWLAQSMARTLGLTGVLHNKREVERATMR
jgi:hypothetical protein